LASGFLTPSSFFTLRPSSRVREASKYTGYRHGQVLETEASAVYVICGSDVGIAEGLMSDGFVDVEDGEASEEMSWISGSESVSESSSIRAC